MTERSSDKSTVDKHARQIDKTAIKSLQQIFSLIVEILHCLLKFARHHQHLSRISYFCFFKKQIVSNNEDLDILKFIMKTKTHCFVVIHRQLACIAYIYGLILCCIFRTSYENLALSLVIFWAFMCWSFRIRIGYTQFSNKTHISY